ncbi:MAG: DUF983 domain-containing protein [Flavobacterium sp.]|nr:DUF983 domain-containing protein [Flavobacterium sp.]
MIVEIKNIFTNRCPNCSKGKVFADKSFYFSLGFPKMNKACKNCGFTFEKEPGFFFGAMFVSYALGVAEALITYFILRPFFEKNFDLNMFPFIMIVLLALMFFNIRLSRMIWIYIFKNYKS